MLKNWMTADFEGILLFILLCLYFVAETDRYIGPPILSSDI